MPRIRSSAPQKGGIAGCALLFLAVTAACHAQPRDRVPVTSQPCEGCEAVFVGMPDSLSWHTRIAPEDEPGEPMIVRGTVYGPDGRPAPGIILYAYHTDDRGVYPPDEELTGHARRHGLLRAWIRTDDRGRYRFDTIRPAPYPGRDIPAHVHMHVIEPGCCTYYINSIRFRDDPLVQEDDQASADAPGGSGLVDPKRVDGVWHVERDIVLPSHEDR